MRRLITARKRPTDDRGAVAVTFAFIALPLIVVLAFVGDAGLLYWEQAQLQNGADAAALAVAQNCIQHSSDCSSGANRVATDIASRNANDGATAAVLDPGSSLQQSHGKAIVTASSPDDDGVPHPFVSLVDPQAATKLHATASVEWGAPVSGSPLAVTIAECEFTDLPPQPEDAPNPTRTWITIQESGNGSKARICNNGTPGGFGWLDDSADGNMNCHPYVSGIPLIMNGTTGIQPVTSKNGCSDVILQSNLCKVILIPLYVSTSGQGTSATYRISRFAAFRLTGLKTGGASSAVYCGGAPLSPPPPSPTGTNKGIQGYFVRYVGLGEDFALGAGAPDGGLTIVRFTS